MRFVLDAGGVADYVDRIRGKYTAKWGVQLSEMAPDLIIEVVSPDSKRMDYYTKLVLYRDAGVKEYWIADPVPAGILKGLNICIKKLL